MIKIQQALWGYSDGHHLLETSTPLSNQAKKILGSLTDLSGNESPSSFDGYLTGYPLKEEKCYALSKTWYATEMSRPGCVWTHTLFIDYDIASNVTAAKIDTLFRRPTPDISDLGEYSRPILLEKCNNGVPAINSSINRIALDLFSIIVQNPSVPIIIASSSSAPFNQALESLIEMLGISFFNDISFCTGSFSNRTINRKPLDLQIAPNTVSKSVRRSNRDEIVYTEYPSNFENVISIENFEKTKEFILYCGDKFHKRIYWLIFSTILAKISSQKPFSTVEIISILTDKINTEDIIRVFTKIIQAIYLPTQYVIEKDLDSKFEILIDLFSSNYEFSNATSIVDKSTVSSIIDLLYNKSQQDVISFINKLSKCTINQIGKSAINHLSEILTSKDFSSLLKQSKNAALWLIPFNLNLALCEDVWKQDKNIQLETLKRLKDSFSNLNYTEINYKNIIYLIFETSDFDIASDLYRTFGDYSIDAFFDWCETEYACIQKSIRWVSLCKYNQTLSIERLKHINNSHLFELVIKVLDPYDEKMKEIPKETWELFYRRFCVNNSSHSINTIFAQFILPIIIESSSQFSIQLTEFAFITVHNILARDEMDNKQWNRLSKLLPDNPWHNVWDKCKRLRKEAKIKNLDIDFKYVD